CPLDAVFRFDTRAEFPAELLGQTDDDRYFWWSLGKTNWPQAAEQLRQRLGLRSPASRYVFEVGADSMPTPKPAKRRAEPLPNQRREDVVRVPLVPVFSSTISDSE
ncbi:MAG: hypothetical protein AAFV29_14935, partial [Myxococcota bacterium]